MGDRVSRPTGRSVSSRRALIAGFGNTLRGDDGFGVAVAATLQREITDPGIVVLEVGIAGITMIQELLDGFEAVVIIDAVQRNSQPGELTWSRLSVADCRSLTLAERQSMLADIHFANPNRALTLARALDLLPADVFLLACEVDPENPMGTELSDPVRSALPQARTRLMQWIEGFLDGRGLDRSGSGEEDRDGSPDQLRETG